jgi:CheY-like chemotaxis protein
MATLPKLLLVEDHRDTGTIFKRLLGQSGYDVSLATNVAEALALFDHEHFDAMVSDIGLPDGSGLDVMRHVAAARLIPSIAVSALSTDEDVERSLAAGFLAHMAKPIDLVSLRMLIAHLTNGSERL